MKALKIRLTGLLLAAFTTAVFAEPQALVTQPNAALQWHAVPNTQDAVIYANAEGDIFGKGEYSAFVTFKAGTDNGLHTHSQALPTVVLKGTFYAVIDNVRSEFPAGSYYHLPANMPHESGCTAAADCLLFQHQTDTFDLIPVQG